MDENYAQILAGLPEKRSRSHLEPYGVLIKELLRRRRTYREIGRILLDKFQIRASISTIHDFVRRQRVPVGKARKDKAPRPNRTRRGNPADMGRKMQMDATGPAAALDDVQKRIAALKLRPLPATETNPTIFHYDPEQPLHLSSKSRKKRSG
jgi:hypothetical protein